MAESKKEKKQNPQDSFADDLDSMLNLDETSEQQVGLVDDDDAIDRLLVDDAFLEPQEEDSTKDSSDIDHLLADDAEIDEFGDDIDDLLANIKPDHKQEKVIEPEEIPPVETVSVDDAVDLSALESVGEIDDLMDEDLVVSEVALESDQINDDLDNMAEIDEFSAEAGNANADFLLADFDISGDEDAEVTASPEAPAQEPESAVEPEDINEPPVADDADSAHQQELIADDEQAADSMFDVESEEELESVEPEVAAAETLDQDTASEPDAAQNMFGAEQLAPLASVTSKIEELLKQQAQINQDIQQKASKDELNGCLDTIDTLQNEQKKSKRNLEAVNNKKPVAAYVAIGISVLALIVGGGLGYQGYAAKSQINKLIEIMDRFQAQLAMAPGAEAEEKEMLRNQLDELARVSSVNTEQIAELNKTLQDAGSSQPIGDSKKQPGDLMQIGAAIESLQNKVSALEKGKAKVVVKAPPKKPVVVRENWVVNLVAFKQDWYAKRKADEFAAKGVPAKVIKADSKGETWYRLSVDGFKSQYEAAAYAARVKKTLNLDSVWLNKNKN